MPSHNNDTERDIRDMITPQRNIRHQLKTAEGYNVFSTVMTISGTCKKQNIAIERAVIELITESRLEHIRYGGERVGGRTSKVRKTQAARRRIACKSRRFAVYPAYSGREGTA